MQRQDPAEVSDYNVHAARREANATVAALAVGRGAGRSAVASDWGQAVAEGRPQKRWRSQRVNAPR